MAALDTFADPFSARDENVRFDGIVFYGDTVYDGPSEQDVARAHRGLRDALHELGVALDAAAAFLLGADSPTRPGEAGDLIVHPGASGRHAA